MRISRGLTLIEVLIASVIIFMAIGLASTVYRQSIQNNLRVGNLYTIAGNLANVRSQIKEQLRVNTAIRFGEGLLMGGVSYEWTVKDVKTKNSKPWRDVESNTANNGYYDLHLYDIEVVFYRPSNGRAIPLPLRTYNMALLEWSKL